MHRYLCIILLLLIASCTNASTDTSKVVLPKERGIHYVFTDSFLYKRVNANPEYYAENDIVPDTCTRKQAIAYLKENGFSVTKSRDYKKGVDRLYCTKIVYEVKMYNIYIYKEYWYETVWGWEKGKKEQL